MSDELLHYGVARKSGRYPWGSGEDPRQHEGAFLSKYESLKAKGKSETDIASSLGMNTTQLRNSITWARKSQREALQKQVLILKDTGMSNVMIANKLGISEATVRNYKSPTQKAEKVTLDNVTEAVRDGAKQTGYLDVGVGVERQLGVSRTKFNTAVNKLVEEDGFHIHEVYAPRLSDPTGKTYTTVKVLTKDPDPSNTRKNSDKIRTLNKQSDDGGLTINPIGPPKHYDLDRIKVRYAEEGGLAKDGLIELRPGVKDLDLGEATYAQVRIAASGKGDHEKNLYLKGMAIRSQDKFPDGVDIIFNTNKHVGTPKDKVLKKMKDDPDNPFGANITRQRGALNIVNQQNDWDTWSTKMSSQFLSKQPVSFVKERLDATYKSLKKEFDEINSLTNPIVKRHLMESFKDGLDSKVTHLKAKGLTGTKSHVLLPVPEMKANEIYAPNYKTGERVVLVRHPHGGRFEIPDLIVNNNNPVAKKLLGNASDAVGIHPSVAGKLSGADFDGDTALVIPNNQGKIKTSKALKELKNFDPNSYKVDYVTIAPRTKQIQMGIVSNLITDMTIKGASDSELARAVRHSMVVIDSEKHQLDYKRSAKDNAIGALRKKYQTHIDPDTGKLSRSASTLISQSKAMLDIPGTKKKMDITDPNFNPDKYSSKTAVETAYLGYIKGVVAIKNEANKAFSRIPTPKYSKEAAKVYAPEVASLNAKLNVALLNAPRERQAQLLTNNLFYSKFNKDMSKDEVKKLKSRSLAAARAQTGAKKTMIKITEREWEAIQNRAISNTKLDQILRNADMDVVRKLATPKPTLLNASKIASAKAKLAKGYTYAEVAAQLGISASALREELGK